MRRTDLQRRYIEHGFVTVPGAFSPDAAERMADAVWAKLTAAHGIRRDDPTSWRIVEPRGLGSLRSTGAFDALATPTLTEAIDALLDGTEWVAPTDWGGPLVTFPSPGSWTVPSTGWHLDYPVRGAPASTLLLKWLAYLEPVVAAGGGTMVIAGSHRLVDQWLQHAGTKDPGRSAAVRDAIFAIDPWFDTLRGRATGNPRDDVLMREGAVVRGVTVRAVELTGQPGDVVFLHPHVLHAAAPNHAARPRLMLTGGLDLAR